MPTDIDKAYIKYIVYIYTHMHTHTHTYTHTYIYLHTHWIVVLMKNITINLNYYIILYYIINNKLVYTLK